MSAAGDRAAGAEATDRVAVVVVQQGSAAEDLATGRSLQLGVSGAELVATTPAGLAAAVAGIVADGGRRHVLVATDHASVAAGSLVRALDLADEDPRIATVSFVAHPGDDAGADLDAAVDRLRAGPCAAVPVPVPSGPVTLVSRHALGACGGLTADPPLAPAALVADLALRAQGRGFASVLDTGTVVAAQPAAEADQDAVGALRDLHPVLTAALAEACLPTSPTVLAAGAITAALRGLAVTIDGTSLRPEEMGTQVLTTSLVAALAARDDVARVCVVVDQDVPPYAATALAHPKVAVARIAGLDVSGVPACDVIHRPFQPDTYIPFDVWRRRGARIVVSLLDLILYEVGTYWPDGPTWSAHRAMLRHSAAASDAVTVISDDVRDRVVAEALPIDPSRLFTVTLGADHLQGDEEATPPAALRGPSPEDEPFLLVLGTDYPHKNQEVAIGAWRLLRAGRPSLRLVLAGARMPFGADGARPDHHDDGLVVLGAVSGRERNWLLRHAVAVLYPTSAEGFGLVPFEAARFGTPTVAMSFGPLREVYGDLPVTADTWTPQAFATATGMLLGEPDAARRQLAAIDAAARRHTWAATASRLVDVYRSVLARPAVQLGVLDATHRELEAARADGRAARAELDAVRASRSYRLATRIAAAARLGRR